MERRFPGEAETSVDPADADHWIEVYGELHRFVRDVVLSSGSESLSQAEVDNLTERLEWLRERLGFWINRKADLLRNAS